MSDLPKKYTDKDGLSWTGAAMLLDLCRLLFYSGVVLMLLLKVYHTRDGRQPPDRTYCRGISLTSNRFPPVGAVVV